MRYLITGGLGMIGSALARHLLLAGHEVLVIDDLSRGRKENLGDFKDHENLQVVIGDASRGMAWTETDAFEPGALDGIFHLAARIGGVGKMYAEPYGQARNIVVDYAVLEQARLLDVPLLYASTACVYPIHLQTEDIRNHLLSEPEIWPAHPESLYGLLKLSGEEMVRAAARQHGVRVSIVRMFNAVGPEHCPIGDRHVIPALLGKLARGDGNLEVWGDGTAERSFLDARDAANALLRCLERASSEDLEAYNIGTEERYSVRHVAEACLAASGCDGEIFHNLDKPAGVHTRAADMRRLGGLGWKTTYTLEETIAWVWSEIS